MCGVAGYISNRKPNSASLQLKKLVNDLKHRGPDGNGIFKSKDSKVGLIHTRLAILDLSDLAKQPMFNKDSSVVLSFNGEIYNFIELKQELESDGIKFRSSSDTEVILELYLKYRHTPNFETIFLNRLNGIFSFAIWDEHFGRMMIARDAMGVKPIYYCLRDDMLAFASELKALINFVPYYKINQNTDSTSIIEKNIDPRLDLEALSRYMTFLWCPGTSTPLENIKKLGPGEFLSFGLNGCIVHKSWVQKKLVKNFDDKKLNQRFITKQSILEAEKLLKNAVQRQMISDVPVGAFLSGGLDSSAIVTFARQINPDIECFTINAQGYEEEGFDDYPYAVKVAKHLGIKLNPVIVKPDDIINNIHKMVEILDEPLADPAALNIYFISEAAKKLGIKVLLSGAGGDDIFSGYRRHFAIKYNSYFCQIPIPLRRIIHNTLNKINLNQPTIRRLKKLFNNHSMETNQFLINCFKWINKNDLESLYSPELRDALKNTSVESPMYEFLDNTNNNLSDLQKSLAMERNFFLADHNLTYTDKMSMAKGVEVRVPFLDNDLVNFASQLPDKVLIKNRNAKWILKKSMQPHLPNDIIYRPKTGFGMPLHKWMKVELRDFINDTLNYQVVARRGLFNPKAVKNLITANEKGEVDMSYTIFFFFFIEKWCQKFL